jgi:hypothetical protein
MDDNNNVLGRSCSRLEEIAAKARQDLLIRNVYHNETGKIYNENHPNALQAQGGSDDRLNIKGKGTAGYLDTENGGGYYDIYGRTDVDGSGRLRALQKNIYRKENPYDCYPNIPFSFNM